VVVEASGKETRGAGTASATIRASLAAEPSGNGTQVTMHTTMNVTGRPAQFGRGVLAEVGGKLVEQFAENVARQIAADTAASPDGGPGAAAPGTGNGAGVGVSEAAGPREKRAGTAAPVAPTTAPPPAPSHEDSLHLVKLVGPALGKRAIAAVLAAVAMILLGRRFWHLLYRQERAERPLGPRSPGGRKPLQ
jgi:uncharacterized protein